MLITVLCGTAIFMLPAETLAATARNFKALRNGSTTLGGTMKQWLIGSVVVVGLLSVATPATAAPNSTVEPVPDVNATVPAGPLCPFEIRVGIVAGINQCFQQFSRRNVLPFGNRLSKRVVAPHANQRDRQ